MKRLIGISATAALAIMALSPGAHAQVFDRPIGTGLATFRVTVAPNQNLLVSITAGCTGSTDTVMYLLEETATQNVLITRNAIDDIVIPDSIPPTINRCPGAQFNNTGTTPKTIIAVVVAQSQSSVGTVTIRRTVRRTTPSPQIIISDISSVENVGGARWLGQTWNTGTCGATNVLMTKPLRSADLTTLPAIEDTMLFAINPTTGSESYVSDDDGIQLFSAIKPRTACSTNCVVLGGAFDFRGDTGLLTIWNNTAGSPLVPSSCDSDSDGVSNSIEAFHQTNPQNFDSDGDGFTDYQELIGHAIGSVRYAPTFNPPLLGPGGGFSGIVPVGGVFATMLWVVPRIVAGFDDSEILPFDNANPIQPDVFVEVDFMPAAPGGATGPDSGNSHATYANLAADLRTIFSDAAFTGRASINVNVAPPGTDARNSQQFAQHFSGIAFDPCTSGPPAVQADRVNFYTLKNSRQNFNPIRSNIFRYVVAADQRFNNGSGGCPLIGSTGVAKFLGPDVIISLGPTATVPAVPVQRGTHIHEYGHTFNLNHHGNDNNPLITGANSCIHASVMSYRYQITGWPGAVAALRNFSYSRGQCDAITAGIPTGCPADTACNAARCLPLNASSPKRGCGVIFRVQTDFQTISNEDCDCDLNEWPRVNLVFQRFRPSGLGGSGAGTDDEIELAYLSGTSTVQPVFFADMMVAKRQGLIDTGMRPGIDFIVTANGDMISPEAVTHTGPGSTEVPCSQMSPLAKLFGFESAAYWSLPGGQVTAIEWPRLQGCAALQVGGSGYRTIQSSPFTTPVAGVTNRVGLGVYVPTAQPNPYWLGAIQVYLTCSGANVFNAYQGQVELTGLPQGNYSGVSFNLSPQAASLLGSSSGQCFWSIAVNTNATPHSVVLDQMSFLTI